MKIYCIDTQNTTFKKGLTSHEVNAIRSMTPFDYEKIAERLKSSYGLNAKFRGNNTVAWCVEQVVEIMDKAGFKLPRNFNFEPISPDTLGTYNSYSDTVTINSLIPEFSNLEQQNLLEERQKEFHPKTRHFLQTYLHEFSHAAHFRNLQNKLGSSKAYELFSGTLNKYSPRNILVGPMNAIIKDITKGSASEIINKVFPPDNGVYAQTNLKEYFAEKNSKMLAQQLGDNYIVSNINPEMKDSYKIHPKDWQFGPLLMKSFSGQACKFFGDDYRMKDFWEKTFEVAKSIIDIVNLCKKEIAYTDGDIFHGNEDQLLNNQELLKRRM